MKPDDAYIGQKVGTFGKIAKINRECMYVVLDNGRPIAFENLEPVSDPCQECEMAATITSQCKQIADLQDACEQNGMLAIAYRQTAAYWRGELEKLQKEALAECDKLPLVEVAKCYKQVEPDQLLLSAEARRVVEYLKARDCPISIHHIFESMTNIMSGMAIMDGLIEARDAGIVRLDDGKYSIVRD